MKRIYRTWIDGKEKLIISDSKKKIKEKLNVEIVEFWCNYTKKDEELQKRGVYNIPIIE